MNPRHAKAFFAEAAEEGEYIAQMPGKSSLAFVVFTKLISSLLTAGKILQLLVKDGQKVAAGDTLLIMESMKMESKIFAHKVFHFHPFFPLLQDTIFPSLSPGRNSQAACSSRSSYPRGHEDAHDYRIDQYDQSTFCQQNVPAPDAKF